MLTREGANQIQAYQAEGTNMAISAIRRFEAMICAALALTNAQVQLATTGKGMWDYSGIAQQILAAPDGQSVGDGQYDAGYLREVQAMWAGYTAWLATNITVVVNGQQVTLDKRPLDLIMSAPVLAAPPAPEPVQPE